MIQTLLIVETPRVNLSDLLRPWSTMTALLVQVARTLYLPDHGMDHTSHRTLQSTLLHTTRLSWIVQS